MDRWKFLVVVVFAFLSLPTIAAVLVGRTPALLALGLAWVLAVAVLARSRLRLRIADRHLSIEPGDDDS